MAAVQEASDVSVAEQSEEYEDQLSYEVAQREELVDAIVAADSTWARPTAAVKVGEFKWLPDLVRPDGSMCHVHLVGSLAGPWRDRIAAARADGRKVVVVAPPECWLSESVVSSLYDLQVSAMCADRNRKGWATTTYRSVPHLVALRGLLLPPETFGKMATLGLKRAREAIESVPRGRTFEEFLALLFSQVRYFTVRDVNFVNATEEIDVVIQNRGVRERALPQTPLVCVSGKNLKDPVGVPALTDLVRKMENRRGQCELGFLCAAGSIAGTVPTDIMRLSRTRATVVTLDGDALDDLITKPAELDGAIERHVLDAMLA